MFSDSYGQQYILMLKIVSDNEKFMNVSSLNSEKFMKNLQENNEKYFKQIIDKIFEKDDEKEKSLQKLVEILGIQNTILENQNKIISDLPKDISETNLKPNVDTQNEFLQSISEQMSGQTSSLPDILDKIMDKHESFFKELLENNKILITEILNDSGKKKTNKGGNEKGTILGLIRNLVTLLKNQNDMILKMTQTDKEDFKDIIKDQNEILSRLSFEKMDFSESLKEILNAQNQIIKDMSKNKNMQDINMRELFGEINSFNERAITQIIEANASSTKQLLQELINRMPSPQQQQSPPPQQSNLSLESPPSPPIYIKNVDAIIREFMEYMSEQRKSDADVKSEFLTTLQNFSQSFENKNYKNGNDQLNSEILDFLKNITQNENEKHSEDLSEFLKVISQLANQKNEMNELQSSFLEKIVDGISTKKNEPDYESPPLSPSQSVNVKSKIKKKNYKKDKKNTCTQTKRMSDGETSEFENEGERMKETQQKKEKTDSYTQNNDNNKENEGENHGEESGKDDNGDKENDDDGNDDINDEDDGSKKKEKKN